MSEIDENNQADVILNESFHEFSLNCIHREMVTTGNTGYHNCAHVLKKTRCDREICPRIKANTRL